LEWNSLLAKASWISWCQRERWHHLPHVRPTHVAALRVRRC